MGPCLERGCRLASLASLDLPYEHKQIQANDEFHQYKHQNVDDPTKVFPEQSFWMLGSWNVGTQHLTSQ